MNNIIQKSTIKNYLSLIDKNSVSETDLYEFVNSVDRLYNLKLLSERCVCRQKIEIILTNIKSEIDSLTRKRVNKTVKMSITNDLYKSLSNNLIEQSYSFESLESFASEILLSIDKNDVIEILNNLIINKRRLSSESDLEKFIHEQLCLIYGKDTVHRQYSIGGFLALKADIDIGNGSIGIELKVVDNLTASDMQRIIGQVIYYKRRVYDSNLLLVLVSKATITPAIAELKSFIEELGISVVYLIATN